MIPEPPDDDVQRFLAERLKDPEFRGLYEDGQDRDRVIDALLARRKALGMSQTDVADRMGPISQSRVAAIERESSDPRLSTVQRYARAVGARLRLVLDDTSPTEGPPPP